MKASDRDRKRTHYLYIRNAILIIGLLIVLAQIDLGGTQFRQFPIGQREIEQRSRSIAMLMYQYAIDNDQKYPDGNSSTEVFQKLLDGKYVSNPEIFYIPMPGKTKPAAGRPLRPENVSFDVTGGADLNASDDLPLVFSTGYKVTYLRGSPAVPLIKPYPLYQPDPRNWLQRYQNSPPLEEPVGIIDCSRGLDVLFKKLDADQKGSPGVISNFIPANFDSKGNIYRQLTPDGPLP